MFTASLIPPQKAVIQNCVDCPLRQFSWLRLVTYPSILQLAANILLPLTITLFAPVNTVGNAVMGSVSKLAKVGDFVHYVVNAGSSVCLLPIHFIYLLKIPLKLDIGILLFCFECGERLCNTWSQSC